MEKSISVGADPCIRPKLDSSFCPGSGRKWDSARTITIFLFGLLVVCFCLLVGKADLLRIINSSLPFTPAGILSGMVLGNRKGFEKGFYNSLVDSGLIHLVVVSGSNVMLLIGGVIESSARYLGRKAAIILGLVLGWKYVVMVEWEIPIVRAMLLLSIYYWAQLLGRKYNLGRGLGLAVLIMFVGEPGILTSVSFWLSIMAFLGVVTKKLIINNYELKIRNKFTRNMIGVFLETGWVTVWILPIIAITFGKVSIVSPVTNVLVLVLVELITVVGAIGSIGGLLWMDLGKVILWILIPGLKYLEMVVMIGGAQGIAPVLQIKFNWLMLVGYYLILLYLLLKNKAKNF